MLQLARKKTIQSLLNGIGTSISSSKMWVGYRQKVIFIHKFAFKKGLRAFHYSVLMTGP